MTRRLVIFGVSNILSDLFDCAHAQGIGIAKIVRHHDEEIGERDLSAADRIASFSALASPPVLQTMEDFRPEPDELYMLGPTTPARAGLAREIEARFGLSLGTLVHPTAYVSPLAKLSAGCFVGANSIIGPGARLEANVFVNRGATVGHDTVLGAFSRVQPGANLGGLSRYGRGVTVGIGASVVERVEVGQNAFIGAGAVVIGDVPPDVLVVGAPAKVKKVLPPNLALDS